MAKYAHYKRIHQVAAHVRASTKRLAYKHIPEGQLHHHVLSFPICGVRFLTPIYHNVASAGANFRIKRQLYPSSRYATRSTDQQHQLYLCITVSVVLHSTTHNNKQCDRRVRPTRYAPARL